MASLESYLSKYKEGLKLARQKVVELQKEKETLEGELAKAAEKVSKVIFILSVCLVKPTYDLRETKMCFSSCVCVAWFLLEKM